jgi:hypothetical protein
MQEGTKNFVSHQLPTAVNMCRSTNPTNLLLKIQNQVTYFPRTVSMLLLKKSNLNVFLFYTCQIHKMLGIKSYIT